MKIKPWSPHGKPLSPPWPELPQWRRAALGAVLACLAWAPAQAAVKYAQSDSAALEYTEVIHAPPTRVYAGFGEIGRWWNGEHSYSQDAHNLSLATVAGGCFCERFAGGSVQHGVVLMALTDQVLRLDAPLGPLQGRAVKAILTFELKPTAEGTELHTSYLINGSSRTEIDHSIAGIDAVVGEALERFKRFIENGQP